MKRFWKRTLSIVLSIAMILGLISTISEPNKAEAAGTVKKVTLEFQKASGISWYFDHSALPVEYQGESSAWKTVNYECDAYKDGNVASEKVRIEFVGETAYIWGELHYTDKQMPTVSLYIPKGTVLYECKYIESSHMNELVTDGKQLILSEELKMVYQEGVWTQDKPQEEIEDTAYDLVRSGTSDYRILLPAKPTANERFAANELQHFIKEATGVQMSIQRESTKATPDKFLSVGDTRVSEAAGVTPAYEELGSNGFVIETIDDNCYIKGYSDMGTRNGIYEWLSYCFDYTCYAPDAITLTEMDSRKLPKFHVVKVPDFEYREGGGEVAMDATGAYRMQYNSNDEIFVTGHSCHNSYEIIDPEGTYDYTSETYKNWFSTSMHYHNQRGCELPAQLCYSNEVMWPEYVKNLKEILRGSTEPSMIIGMEDNNLWCTCDACTASLAKYGTNAATIVKFANYVQEQINAWCDEEHRAHVQMVIFAYHQCEQPPVTWDAAAEGYVPADDSVRLHADIGVMYAPIRASYAYSFNDSINAEFKEQIDGWSSLTDNLYAWTYSMYPADPFVFMDTFGIIQENYQYFYQSGFKFIFDQLSSFNEKGNPGWERAKNYVMSRLMWDVNADVDALLDDFFANYYDVAGDIMREVMDENSAYIKEHILSQLKYEAPTDDNYSAVQGNIFVPILDNYGKSFTKEYLEGALAKLEQAYTAIEPFKYSEPERYEGLYNRILLEGMQFRYILCRFVYDPKPYDKTQQEYKWQFRTDMEKLGIATVKEAWTAEEFWTNIWGMPEYNKVQISFAEIISTGQIYLKGEIVEGTNKGQTICDVYGDWKIAGTGELQLEIDGRIITENVNWCPFNADPSHDNASLYLECPDNDIKDHLAEISTFSVKAGTTIVIGNMTPIYIVNDIDICRNGEGWCECNTIDLTYTQTIDGKLYLRAEILAGPDAGKTMKEAYGDWKTTATGDITYTVNGIRKKGQSAYWNLYADNPHDYNSNVYLRNNDVISNFANVSSLCIERGQYCLCRPATLIAPFHCGLKIPLHLRKRKPVIGQSITIW